jgi:hypothetical protein
MLSNPLTYKQAHTTGSDLHDKASHHLIGLLVQLFMVDKLPLLVQCMLQDACKPKDVQNDGKDASHENHIHMTTSSQTCEQAQHRIAASSCHVKPALGAVLVAMLDPDLPVETD